VTAAVHIYLEAADSVEMECIRHPGGPGCRHTGTDVHRRGTMTPLARVMLLAVPVMIAGLLLTGGR